MLRAVYRSDPLRLRHQMELTNWKLDPVVPVAAFAPAKAATAVAMAFSHPDAKAAAALKPPAIRKPAKVQSANSQ
ncbi:MAG: DUF2092 domain-containing protein [Candidatus Accumulibacter phosphatis]|nr:DUF2092 domain-containing protein [Candidatus Accumulibacter phosphatis]